jgi:Zn ribbon nucleic-acid-binding protein
MRRDAWTFDYAARDLAEAAAKRCTHHQQRTAWWESKKTETLAQIRESGIEISESVATGYSAANATFGPQLRIKDEVKQALTECFVKIKEHTAAARKYEGWSKFLNANPDAELKIDQSDWAFFFDGQDADSELGLNF